MPAEVARQQQGQEEMMGEEAQQEEGQEEGKKRIVSGR